MRAIWADGSTVELREVEDSVLDSTTGDDLVDIRVEWSTLNYKDALAVTGKAKVLRTLPLIPGIDLAGVVESSASDAYTPGDAVLVTGYGIGEHTNGGLAERARVPAGHVVRVPDGMTTRDAMRIGTAGFTSMLAVHALERHGLTPDAGDVVVTGAAGGVGSIAVIALARRGFRVVASSGRPELGDYLSSLGAAETIGRDKLASAGRPLEKERWAGAVDTVGSQTLASVCAATARHGVVAACGNAGGMDFPATVAPFILRGVTLVGIDSVMSPMDQRVVAWDALAADLDPERLAAMTDEIGLSEAIGACDRLLAGSVRGRLVVDVTR